MSKLTTNTADLQAILDKVNALPNAGSGGGSVETCTVTITQIGGNVIVPMEDAIMFYTGADGMITSQFVNNGSIVTVVKNSLVVLHTWSNNATATNAEEISSHLGCTGYKITGDAVLSYIE